MIEKSDQEWSLRLTKHQTSCPTAENFENFHTWTTGLFEQMQIPASHIVIRDGVKKAQWQKYGGVATKRLISSNFSGTAGFLIGHAPPHSKVVERDRLAKSSIFFSRSIELFSIQITINNSIIRFQDEFFTLTLRKILESNSTDYGWATIDTGRNADLHIMCVDHPRVSESERIALNRWYTASTEEQQRKIRDIYPVNIFHARHLLLPVGQRTLEDFIHEVPGTRVEVIAGHTVWTMPPEMVEGLREVLGAAGVLIARG